MPSSAAHAGTVVVAVYDWDLRHMPRRCGRTAAEGHADVTHAYPMMSLCVFIFDAHCACWYRICTVVMQWPLWHRMQCSALTCYAHSADSYTEYILPRPLRGDAPSAASVCHCYRVST
jgi:hypothetical protein